MQSGGLLLERLDIVVSWTYYIVNWLWPMSIKLFWNWENSEQLKTLRHDHEGCLPKVTQSLKSAIWKLKSEAKN